MTRVQLREVYNQMCIADFKITIIRHMADMMGHENTTRDMLKTAKDALKIANDCEAILNEHDKLFIEITLMNGHCYSFGYMPHNS